VSRVTSIFCGKDLNNLLTEGSEKGLRSAGRAAKELAESEVTEGGIAPSSTRRPVHRLRSNGLCSQGRTEEDTCSNLVSNAKGNVHKEMMNEKHMNE